MQRGLTRENSRLLSSEKGQLKFATMNFWYISLTKCDFVQQCLAPLYVVGISVNFDFVFYVEPENKGAKGVWDFSGRVIKMIDQGFSFRERGN